MYVEIVYIAIMWIHTTTAAVNTHYYTFLYNNSVHCTRNYQPEHFMALLNEFNAVLGQTHLD